MSFGETLAMRAAETPDQVVFTLLEDGQEDETVTFLDLHRKAQNVASLLREQMPESGSAMLLFPPGIDYVAALFGCFQAGVIAVSAPPPQPSRLHRALPRLQAIADDAEVSAVLTAEFIRDAAGTLFEGGPLSRVKWIATDTLAESGEVEVVAPDLSKMAFLQYTSGSTSDPRGVMLSHENLLDNSDRITETLIPREERKLLLWLPPYHDMGLIGGLLQPVHAGLHCLMMSPLAVIKRPARWLEAMSKHRATVTGGPNFGYDLCVRRIDDELCDDLDLSAWRVAFNGAEPIRAETVRAFSAKFERCGFDPNAFQAGYGLAEATLIVSGGEMEKGIAILEADAGALEDGVVRPAEAGAPAKPVVSSGTPVEGFELAIVDPEDGRLCDEGEVGEIWVAGPSVALGYWRDPAKSAEVFEARTAADPEKRYLRTGDLAAVVQGELYVVGRSKELIIVNGRNVYPHDIEYSAEGSSPLLRGHCSAAFEIEVDGEVRIAIVLEVNPADPEEYEQVLAGVRKQVGAELDLPLYWVGLCPPRIVPKTTSGKIQRRLCKAMLEGGEVELLAETPGTTVLRTA
jgi:acyl-CoA synthetase (AMP-forming)/AMP-acid ligase II